MRVRFFAALALMTQAAVIPPAVWSQAASRRPIQINDLYRLSNVSDPQRSPEGGWVAYTVARADSAKDKNDSDIWMTSWDGAQTIRVTSSEESENAPRWSPDGKYLTFLSRRQGAKASQVWLLNRAGGEAEKLTDLKGGVSAVAWAPDSRRLALIVKDPDPDADSAENKPKPLVIDRYHFKQDGEGYLRHLRPHVWLFDLSTKKAEQVVTGDADDNQMSWSPDGKWIAFVSQREPDAERYANSDVYVVEPKAGAVPRRLTTFNGPDTGPLSWSPDSRLLAYLHGEDPRYSAYQNMNELAVVDVASGTSRVLTAALDRPFANPSWSADGAAIYGVVTDDGHRYLARVKADGSGLDRMDASLPAVTGYSMGKDGGAAILASGPDRMPEIYALEGGRTRALSQRNTWISGVQLSTVETVTSTSDDGTVVTSILRRPPNAPRGPLPMVAFIHGGPAAQDEPTFEFTREVLAAQGWLVLSPNYRGSAGRGKAYTKAIWGDWCNKEVRDIHGAIDQLVKNGAADSTRLAVGGWSYGGILTDCLIAADPRFKAAASGAGVSDVLGFYGHDQYIVQYDLELGPPWKNVDAYLNVAKAFLHADRIRTPTLFLGGSADANVPVLGGEQMYQALRSLGVETQLIVYPGENHGISRPSFQRDRLERYVEWFARHLKAGEKAAVKPQP